MNTIFEILLPTSVVGVIFFVGFFFGIYINGRTPRKSVSLKYIEKLEKENKDLRFSNRLLMRHDD